jgi:uncharacterized protein (DUF1015 family)
MTDVRPFRALRYDPRVVDLDRVLAPPYDVVSAEERVALYARDPYSAAQLVLTRTVEEERDTDYAHVPRLLAGWRESGVLVRDPSPALYGLRQRFRAPGDAAGPELVREGFFASLRLAAYEERVVLPHERTLAGPKQDRLKLLRATRTNLSSVFFLYEDPGGALASALGESELLARATDTVGVRTELTRITSPRAIEAAQRFFAERPVLIADGHHRYETALAYRDERRAAEPAAGADAPFERMLGYFANAYAPGTLLLPIHRVVRKGPAPTDRAWRERLPGWSEARFALAGVGSLAALLAAQLAPHGRAPAFAADDGSGTLRVFHRPGDGELSIRVLHREVIEGVFGLDESAVRDGAVGFPKSAEDAAREVREGRAAVALYVNALAAEDVFRVTRAGERLPQKSTFFLPKLPTGLVFRDLVAGDA